MNLRVRVATLLSVAGLATLGLAGGIGANADATAAQTPAVTWSVRAMPAPTGAAVVVKAVSCPTTSFCMAVGWALSRVGSPAPGPSRPVAETWNGRTWTIRHPTTPAGTSQTQLLSVSCPTATDCTVVGGTGRGDTPSIPLAESWNGSTWRVEDAVNLGQDQVDELMSVSCPSTAYCAAVGTDEGPANPPLREDWHGGGKGWELTSGAAPIPGTQLISVSCQDRDSCVTGGEENTSPPGQPVIYRSLLQTWNGSSWSMTRVGTVIDTELTEVACSSAAACVATGNQRKGVGFSLVGRNGRWATGPAPGLSPTALACAPGRSTPGGSRCVATGFNATTPTDPPLSSVWNGTTWAKASTVPTTGGADLSGVSCPTGGRCVAVGFSAPLDSRPIAAVGTLR